MAKLLAHREQPIPSLQDVRPMSRSKFEAVFKKMVAKKIEDRYQTMSEVVAALEQCSAGSQTSVSIQQSVDTSLDSDALTFLKDAPPHASHISKKTKKVAPIKPGPNDAGTAKAGSAKKKFILVAVGAGFLGLAILVAVIFKLRTKDGTLVVEINQPDATVQVLDADGKVEFTPPGGKGPISISVDPGKHRLRVEKEGFQFFAQDFEMDSGGTASIKATLERLPAAAEIHGGLPLPEIVFGSWFPLLTSPDHLIGWDALNDNVHYSNRTIETRDTEFSYPVVVKDVTIRAKAKRVSGRNIDLALRKSDKGSYAAWYNGFLSFGIGKTVDGKWSDLKRGNSSQPINGFFDFRFSASGETLTLFVNDQPLLQATDSSHATGTVGVGGNGVGQFMDVALFIPPRNRSLPTTEGGRRK